MVSIVFQPVLHKSRSEIGEWSSCSKLCLWTFRIADNDVVQIASTLKNTKGAGNISFSDNGMHQRFQVSPKIRSTKNWRPVSVQAKQQVHCVQLRWLRTAMEKFSAAPSCINHMFWCSAAGSFCNSSGKMFIRKAKNILLLRRSDRKLYFFTLKML